MHVSAFTRNRECVLKFQYIKYIFLLYLLSIVSKKFLQFSEKNERLQNESMCKPLNVALGHLYDTYVT